MSFSLNPLEFVKIASERRKINRDQLIEWLDAVRADGRLLAESWIKVAAYMRDNPGCVPDEWDPTMVEQHIFCTRLDGFYEYASVAVSGRLQTTFWNGFVERLGGVLDARGNARSLVREFRDEQRILLDCTKKVRSPNSIEKAIQTLQKQLAELDVFIQTIKAAPKAIR